MKFCNLSFAIIALVFSTSGHSALIDSDWHSAGDNLTIKDTDTGLTWLDLSATASFSHDAVVANLESGGAFYGFRLATQDEVLAFWSNAGITNYERVWETTQFAPVENLVERLGSSTMFEPGLFPVATHAIGMAEGGPALSPDERWAMELTYAPDGTTSRTSASFYTWKVVDASEHYSTYLVSAVPVPAAVWLFASGLLGMIGLAKRKV